LARRRPSAELLVSENDPSSVGDVRELHDPLELALWSDVPAMKASSMALSRTLAGRLSPDRTRLAAVER
jgi:hypothetical protein